MLIRDNKLGDALAKVLGNSGVALIRGHGFVAVADSTPVVVYRAIYTQMNARVQAEGMKLGTIKYLTPGEAEKAQAITEGTSGGRGNCGSRRSERSNSTDAVFSVHVVAPGACSPGIVAVKLRLKKRL